MRQKMCEKEQFHFFWLAKTRPMRGEQPTEEEGGEKKQAETMVSFCVSYFQCNGMDIAVEMRTLKHAHSYNSKGTREKGV